MGSQAPLGPDRRWGTLTCGWLYGCRNTVAITAHEYSIATDWVTVRFHRYAPNPGSADAVDCGAQCTVGPTRRLLPYRKSVASSQRHPLKRWENPEAGGEVSNKGGQKRVASYTDRRMPWYLHTRSTGLLWKGFRPRTAPIPAELYSKQSWMEVRRNQVLK